MQDVFESRYKRKIFFTISSLALVVLFVIRYFTASQLLPAAAAMAAPVFVTVLDALISTFFATIGIAWLIFWLSPPVMQRSRLRVIEPREIRSAIEEGRAGASEWWYMGGAGRYTRAVTLPAFARMAREQNASKKLVILILDPRNTESCERYVEFRNSLRSGSNSKWSLESVQNELLATIVAAYCWRAEQTRLDVSVGLRAEFSVFRIDLSDTRAVVTKEDKQEPAILCESKSFYHDAYFEDVRLALRQAKTLPSIPGSLFKQLTVQSARSLLDSVGISTSRLTDSRLSAIVELSKDTTSPYA